MKPKFKIKETKEGKFEVYYVERPATFWRKEKLVPYLTWAGLDHVYPFSSLQSAIENLKIEVIKNTKLI